MHELEREVGGGTLRGREQVDQGGLLQLGEGSTYYKSDIIHCPCGLCLGTVIPPNHYDHDMGAWGTVKERER